MESLLRFLPVEFKKIKVFYGYVNFIVALNRAAGTPPTPWNVGFVEIRWITEDFTESEVQQGNGRSCFTFKRFRSKAFSSILDGSVMAIFLRRRG